MKVPLLDLKKQYSKIKKEAQEALLKVAESQMLVLGPEVELLEQNLAEYCGVQHAIGVSSGTDALLATLMALDLKPYDEVILPTYSFFATAGVVSRLNAVPVFVDIDPITYNIDPEGIRALINAKTKAIIPVHLYGQMASMNEIMDIADKNNIPVVEDAAQAIGSQFSNGFYAGSIGLAGCFSFYPTKNLGAFGEGGLITTNNEQFADKLKKLRNHGMAPKYYHNFIGGNFRLQAIQAAVLNVKYPHLEDWHESRRKNANTYNKLFIESGLSQKPGITDYDDNNKVLLPKAVFKKDGHRNYHIYNQYIIRVEKRNELRQFLSDKEIGSEIYYPVPFHRQKCFQNLGYKDSQFPVANKISSETLALPIFPELTFDQINYVVDTISEFIKKHQ